MRAALARSTPSTRWLAGLLLAALVGGGIAPAHGSLGQDLAYGSDRLQRLSFWRPASKADRPAPLILFVHGGGWKRGDRATATGRAKVSHFLGRGYAFATMNYRLVPAATVEQQAADVASALAWLVRHAGRLEVDPKRIVLMGHSARAPPSCGTPTPRPSATTLRASGPFPPPGRRPPPMPPPSCSCTCSASMEPPRPGAVGGRGLKGHIAINRRLGQPDDPATVVVDAWLRRLFGR